MDQFRGAISWSNFAEQFRGATSWSNFVVAFVRIEKPKMLHKLLLTFWLGLVGLGQLAVP